MDWLVDHKGDFTIAAQKLLGSKVQIDWSKPRLILVAESFSEYDKYAVNRIGANVELWTYRRYGDDLLYLDPIFVATAKSSKPTKVKPKEIVEEPEQDDVEVPVYTVEDHLARKSDDIKDLFEQLRERIFSLAEEGEIIEKANKMYIGYKHGKNFCEVRIQTSGLKLWLDISPSELIDPYKLVRDVSNIGHYGTGDVELKLGTSDDINKLMALIEQSYKQTI